MQDPERDQCLVHAGCVGGDLPSLAPQTLDFEAPLGPTATSQQSSGSESDVAVGEPSAALAAPGLKVQPWVAEPLSAGPVNAQVSKPATSPATSRQISRRACRGTETLVQDEAADVASGQHDASTIVEAREVLLGLNPSSDTEAEGRDSSVAPSMSTEPAVEEYGSQSDVPHDGRIPAVNSDSTTYGDPVPYVVDLFVDDKLGLIPPDERSFRGKLDTGSEVNILATSIASRMQLMGFKKSVDANYRIRGLSRSAVPVRGQLTITVNVYYELIEFSCRAVWLIVDDKYINGSFDALVGLPVINESEKLGVIVLADRAFGNTSSGAPGVSSSDGQLEIEDDIQDPGSTTAPTG